MSANNYIRISKYINPSKFVVTDADMDTGVGGYVGQCATVEQAIEIAEAYCEREEVEYGIRFEL